MASVDDNPCLPFHLISSILLWLPVESIVRFRSVCKEWKNLFKTPWFIAEHFHLHSGCKNPSLLLHEYDYEHMRSSLRLVDHKMETVEVLSTPWIDSFRRDWSIVGSCNGLLCLVFNGYISDGSIWLWNPAIGEVREVPSTIDCSCFVFNVGFGYSSVVNDFKIVRFYHCFDVESGQELCDRVKLYSLSTDSWKELEYRPLEGIENLFVSLSEAVSTDETIFWLSLTASTKLISFDIAREVFTVTPIPTDYGISPFQLDVYENKLARLYGFTEEDGSHFIHLWVMEEVASESGKSLSCTQKYSIEKVSHVSDDAEVLCVWRNEIVCHDRKYMIEMEGGLKCALFLLNLITNEERYFSCLNAGDRCDAFNYEKSLVSVWNTQQDEQSACEI